MRLSILFASVLVAVGCASQPPPSVPTIAELFAKDSVEVPMQPGSYDRNSGAVTAYVPVREGTLVLEVELDAARASTASTITLRPAQLTTFYGIGIDQQPETLTAATASAAFTDPNRRSICGHRQLFVDTTVGIDGVSQHAGIGFGLVTQADLADTGEDFIGDSACSVRGNVTQPNNPNCDARSCNVILGTGAGGGVGACAMTLGIFCFCNAGLTPTDQS